MMKMIGRHKNIINLLGACTQGGMCCGWVGHWCRPVPRAGALVSAASAPRTPVRAGGVCSQGQPAGIPAGKEAPGHGLLLRHLQAA